MLSFQGEQEEKTFPTIELIKSWDPLKRIFDEASDRYSFISPFYKIKALKIPKTDIQPFNLPEVNSVINNVRVDYKNYYTTRLFSGMRTGEIDGLKWKYIDFESRIIKIRETIVVMKIIQKMIHHNVILI